MRLLVTADLHVNHPRSRESAIDLINQMNRAGGDGVLLVGDTAVGEPSILEEALARFSDRFVLRLFVPGNHELWSNASDGVSLLESQLPARVESVGWRWLMNGPVDLTDCWTIVGSLGWYDHSFAEPSLEIAPVFYERHVSPGATLLTQTPSDLIDAARASSPAAQSVVARWNDRKMTRTSIDDALLCRSLVDKLADQIDSIDSSRRVIAAVHTVPFAELLPPRRNATFDFARAYLGSRAIGAMLKSKASVQTAICGHSHFPARARIGPIDAINIGAGYREKRFETIDVE